MSLTMPQTRKVIRQQDAMANALRKALKARGFTRKAQREKLAQRAASGRPANLPEIARVELERWRKDREFKAVIDSIAGRSA